MSAYTPKKVWLTEDDIYTELGTQKLLGGDIPYIRADIVDELVEALEFAWPIIEHERYKWDCSYGKNFDEAKADRARKACEKAEAALAKARGEG